MAVRVIPIDDSTFDSLIALRDEDVPAIAADEWPPAPGRFSIQVAGSAEFADATWQLDVERSGSNAAEFRLEPPYWVSPTTDPCLGFAVWGDAGVVLAIDPGEIGEPRIAVSRTPPAGPPDDPAFWMDLIDRILVNAYDAGDQVDWDLSGQQEPESTGATPGAADGEFELDVSGTRWQVRIASRSYDTVRYTLTTSDSPVGRREVEAYAFAFSGLGIARVAFDDAATGQYGALAVPFEMLSNDELDEQPSRLADFVRVMIAALQGDLGQRIVLLRTPR